MRLTFLGKETQTGGSPTLFGTDRDTYVVQGMEGGRPAGQRRDPAEAVGLPRTPHLPWRPDARHGVRQPDSVRRSGHRRISTVSDGPSWSRNLC